MKLQIRWKLTTIFTSLLFLFVLIQWVLIFFYEKSLFVTTLFSFVSVAILAYLLLKSFTRPIESNFSKTIDEMNFRLKDPIKEISREKDYLQTILKGMAEGVLVVDGRGRIRMVNEALRKLFPIPPEVLDRTLLELIRNAELEEAIKEAIRNGKNSAFELTLPSSPGRNFEVNVVGIRPASERINEEGLEMGGAIAVFHDISRLKELERIRQDFVANVSHELRTPLTTIKGYVETLLEGAMKEEVAFQFIQVIKRHTDRLTKIVEDLLTLSKIESKEFQLKMEVFPLRDLIDDIMGFVKEPAAKKKIAIFQNEILSSLTLMADRNYLEQVLINLLDNAIKYTPEGGRITISAIENNSKEIQCSVGDNGIGIPREDLPRIFERFYRVDKGRSQELGGTGLGLSIVKHLVQAHGGRVWAESRLGEGSTFHFTLSSPVKSEK
ncbi:MAG: ATP-binding protein [Thermodesulfobacteriota bacterium]|nr:ATP-binding protein [Thermodesulfobacteriota bacterium]